MCARSFFSHLEKGDVFLFTAEDTEAYRENPLQKPIHRYIIYSLLMSVLANLFSIININVSIKFFDKLIVMLSTVKHLICSRKGFFLFCHSLVRLPCHRQLGERRRVRSDMDETIDSAMDAMGNNMGECQQLLILQ